MVSTIWVNKVLLEDIRANENILAKSLNRMKAQALTEIHGGFDVSYSYLPNYCEVIKSTNPSLVAHCIRNLAKHPERPLYFYYIFISFKGNYDGVLLSAIALNRNNEMFPLAWVVVSYEDERKWKFFIHHLKTLL
ncbi:1-deoxy-D-xylulose-5-phosphate synthase [Bienertia sinuspersici]